MPQWDVTAGGKSKHPGGVSSTTGSQYNSLAIMSQGEANTRHGDFTV